jgi:hypothetical protein
MSGKRKLWRDLIDFKSNNVPGEWCLGGDFNAVLKIGDVEAIAALGTMQKGPSL